MLKFRPSHSNKSATKKIFKENEISPRKRNDKEPKKINRMNVKFLEDQVTYWTLSLKEEVQKPAEDKIQNPTRFTSGKDICKEIKESNSVAEESTKYSTSNKSKNCAQIHCSELNANKPGILRRFLNKFHTKETAKESKILSGKNNEIPRKENRTSGNISKRHDARSTKSSKVKTQNKQYYPQLSTSQNKSKEVEESISIMEGCGTFSASNKSDNCLQIHEVSTDRVEIFRKKETLGTDVTTPAKKRIEDNVENTDFTKTVPFEDSSVTVIKQFLEPEFYACHAYNSKKKNLLLSKEEHAFSEPQVGSLSELEMVKYSGDNFDGVFIDGNCPEKLTNFCSTDTVQEKNCNETQKIEDEFSIRQLCKEAEETDSKELFATACHSDSLSSLKSSSIKNEKLLISASGKERHYSMKVQKTDLTKVDSDEDSTQGTFIDDNYTECLSKCCSTETVKEKYNNEIPKTEEEFLVNEQCKEVEEINSRGLLVTGSSSYSFSPSENSCNDGKNLFTADKEKDEYSSVKAQLTDFAKDNGPCFSGNGLNLQVKQPTAVSLSEKQSSSGNISERTDNGLKAEMAVREESSQLFFTASIKHLDQNQNLTEASNSTLQETGSNVEVGLYDVRVYGDVINTSQKQEQNKTGNCDGDNAD